MGFKKKFEDETSSAQATTQNRGNWGEQVAVEHLVSLGYAIVDQQWRCGHYEVDIVAQKGQRVVFAEVKTRKNGAVDPMLLVNDAKQRRIIRSADVYMHMYDIPFEYQFDIIIVVGDRENYSVEHIPDAYFPRPK